MKNKKPIRTCVYTKKKDFKENLIRLVKEEDTYILDKSKKIQKRGIYIYPCDKSLVMLDKNKRYLIKEEEKEKIKKEIIEKIKAGEIDVK